MRYLEKSPPKGLLDNLFEPLYTRFDADED